MGRGHGNIEKLALDELDCGKLPTSIRNKVVIEI